MVRVVVGLRVALATISWIFLLLLLLGLFQPVLTSILEYVTRFGKLLVLLIGEGGSGLSGV